MAKKQTKTANPIVPLLLRPWKGYYDFFGRSGRLEYALFTVAYYAIVELFARNFDSLEGSQPALAILLSFFLVSTVPMFAVFWRRARDIGFSGWLTNVSLLISYLVVTFLASMMFGLADKLPIISTILTWCTVAAFSLIPGSKGRNRFGEPAAY